MPTHAADDVLTVGALDHSCRWPVSYFFIKAIGWLVIASLLLVIAAIKTHSGSFLADAGWLTLGRIRPAAMNAFLYGFAFQAGLGASLWLLARLGRGPILNRSLMVFSAIIWNIGVFLGIIAILAGYSSGFRWLEMPRFVVFLMFASYALIGIWAIISFHLRTQRELYVSQWYLLAALFFFPWLYSAANYLLLAQPVRGVVQAAVNAWYMNGFFWLCLAPIGLAILYYFVPKVLGRPLQNRALAAFGFWTYIFTAPWMGMTYYTGGPFPVWMISTGIAASILLLVPLAAMILNVAGTLSSQVSRPPVNSLTRFTAVSALSFLVGALLHVITSARSVAQITQFTFVPSGVEFLLLFGFVAMALFCAIYFILPRVTGVEWPSSSLLRLHFWMSLVGVALILIGFGVGGLIQGQRFGNANVDMIQITKGITPFIGVATLGFTAFFLGQCAFAVNAFKLYRRFCTVACRACCRSATEVKS